MEEPCFSEGFRGPPDRLPEKESEGGGTWGAHILLCAILRHRIIVA